MIMVACDFDSGFGLRCRFDVVCGGGYWMLDSFGSRCFGWLVENACD